MTHTIEKSDQRSAPVLREGKVTPSKKAPTKRKRSHTPHDPQKEEVNTSASKESVQKSFHNQDLGQRGEAAATRFLERKGFYIHDRNWTCIAGEADIVAEDEDTLVFVEVKTRSNCEKGLPEEAVDAKKRSRYEKIAALYLRDHDFVDKAVRFDVVSIVVMGGDRAFLRHHYNAFATGV